MGKYYSKNTAFNNCILRAQECPADEAAQYYRLAVMLDPAAEEGYLGLIDCLKEGSSAAAGGNRLLRDAFASAEYNRTVRNIDSLRSNEEGYEKVKAAVISLENKKAAVPL